MTGPTPQQLGNIGVSAVGLKLERPPFWWGIADNARDDRGIDLLVKARDSSLGVEEFHIGVQVKTGESYFERPKRGEGRGIVGWWYLERNKKRFNYWLGCDVPVLLVLHNEDLDLSYWVHVTRDAVVSTGKGAKILVPRHQTIGEQSKNQLLHLATGQRASLTLEGTVVPDGLDEIPTERRLRYALVVPRFVAPHAHTTAERPIDAVEAIALLARGDFRGLRDCAETHVDVPDPEAVPANASWGWQFTGAIWEWLATDSLDRLKGVHEAATDCHSATASGVLLACALARRERQSDAIAVHHVLSERDDLDALDRAWVLVQRARLHADLGDFDAAQSDAAKAHQLLVDVHDDIKISAPMVSALAASAARTLHVIASTRRFRDRPAATESVEVWVAEQQKAYLDLLQASDTTVSWWRSQDVAAALGREQGTSFESWARDDPPQRFRSSPMPETKLFAAEFNADIIGEHGHWQALSARRGIQSLMRAASFQDTETELEEGLSALRRCGDASHLSKAIHHLLKTGPLAPLAAAVNKTPMSGWTHTTARTNFEALALAGDLIEQSNADELLEQCARAACGESTELGCTQDDGYFSLPAYATDAAAGVLPAASTGSHDSFAGYLARLPEVAPVLFLRGLDRALFFLDFTQVGTENRRALLSLADRDHAGLSASVWGWFARRGDMDALASLKRAAVQGEIDALAEIEDVTVFDETESAALIDALRQRVEQIHTDALAGGGNSGSSAFCHALTRLNLRIPSAARWEPVIALLGEPRTYIEDKRAICNAITADAQLLPADLRDQLAGVVDVAATGSASFCPGAEAAGIELRLKAALGLIEGCELDDAIARLALGSHLERQDACQLLRSSPCANRRLLLRVLTSDADFTVRYGAAHTAAHLIASEADDADIDLAWGIARNNGRQLPLALIRGFGDASGVLAPLAAEIAESLEQHASAAIRHHVARLQQSRRAAD